MAQRLGFLYASLWLSMDVVEENSEESSRGMDATLEAAEQALQWDSVMLLTGQQGVYGRWTVEDRTGSRPFLKMAVRRDRRVKGGRWRFGVGDIGHDRLSHDERQLCGRLMRLEPGARKCFLTGIIEGVKVPE